VVERHLGQRQMLAAVAAEELVHLRDYLFRLDFYHE
jgi:hypothetical protein